MVLGEKIRRERLEAGLSQRQLCGGEVTRNMLSLIENGAAKPSMKTLTLFAQRLGKPVSYFLDEEAPDPTDLTASAEALRRASGAMEEGRDIYAAQLLKEVTSPLLLREALLLSARLPGADPETVCRALPSLDEELLLRADCALESGEPERCQRLLEAAENWDAAPWQLLMGKLCLSRAQWAEAAGHLQKAEDEHPEVIPLLEQCFRELGDYKQAYEYACKQKK